MSRVQSFRSMMARPKSDRRNMLYVVFEKSGKDRNIREPHAYDGDRAAADGIIKNAIAPGPTETKPFRANNPPDSEGEARYLKGVPMKRFAQPGEIAAAIAFPAGDKAAFITGQTLFVDGGTSVGRL
jgi:hypothetical protein